MYGRRRSLRDTLPRTGRSSCLLALTGIALAALSALRGGDVAHARLAAAKEPQYDYDLFTIGGGSAGVRASRWSTTQYGAKVGLAELPFGYVSEKHEAGGLGGTCVIRGCVPKKLFIYGSDFHEALADAAGYGWHMPRGRPRLDWGQLVAAKNTEVSRLNAIYSKMLDAANVTVHQGYAKLVDPHTVEVNGKRITSKYICIATGSRATVLPIPGADLPGVVTSDEALMLPRRPDKIVVVGGGYVALEFAGFFHGFGSEVHLVTRKSKPLHGFDDDVRSHVAEMLAARGIHVHSGENALSIERARRGKLLFRTDNGTELVVDNVLFATGRSPNSWDLGLEEAGVKLDGDSGKVLVDAHSKTSVDSVYALGDVTDRMTLTPVALMEGMAMAKTLFGGTPTMPDYEGVPSAVFSQPPVAMCGLTEEDAARRYGSVDVYISKFTPMKHNMPTGRGPQERTLMKMLVVTDGFAGAGRVVGLHMVGADAPEMIQGLAVAMKANATKAIFDATVGIHPTGAEEWVTMRTKTRTTLAADVADPGL